ncbi:MAG: hypothetical protein WAQ98_12720 [Blastocatellia bacterium]
MNKDQQLSNQSHAEIDRRVQSWRNKSTKLAVIAAIFIMSFAVSFAPTMEAYVPVPTTMQARVTHTVVPSDAQATCTVESKTFNNWFVKGIVTANGLVKPANSVNFNDTTPNPPVPNTINCNFYQWAEQMFLWLTSPIPSSNGDGGHVFNSSTFYTVLEDGTMIPNMNGINAIGIRKDKTVDGQADGRNAALMGQGEQLVYYSMHVNDVYAYFAKQNLPVSTTSPYTLKFPTTQKELDAIVQYAKKQGVEIPDPMALAMELKIAWVEVKNGMDTSKYVTMQAEIPTFSKSQDNAVWAHTGKKTALLAMVGMHVVGSVAGHPEMIWATYEHDTNTPNAQYSYVNKNGDVITRAQEISQNMLFAADGSVGPFNQEHMRGVGIKENRALNLVRLGNFAVSPSDTLRLFPWGANDQVPNPNVPSAAVSNTEIISINNNIRSMLNGDDVRKNYLLIGATWTKGGVAPSVMPLPPGTTSNQVGTSSLANSTMETYVTKQNNLNNCFACHTGQQTRTGPNTNTVAISHIFTGLNTKNVK